MAFFLDQLFNFVGKNWYNVDCDGDEKSKYQQKIWLPIKPNSWGKVNVMFNIYVGPSRKLSIVTKLTTQSRSR